MAEALAPRCGLCKGIVEQDEPALNFGDLLFHRGCSPRCATCGRPLYEGGAGWRSEGRVVSEPWGYSVYPERFWCPECLGSSPRDEPRAHF